MSKTVKVNSPSQFNSLLSSSKVVVVDFYADWCAPCKTIAPVYEQVSQQLSRKDVVTFAKVNTDEQQEIAQTHTITAMPTFLIFKNKTEVQRIRGANAPALRDAVMKIAAEADNNSASGFGETSSSSSHWLGASTPRGYIDVTSEVDVRGLDLLNADGEFGTARTLFEAAKPSALVSSKGKGKAERSGKDWVESDTDEQLMLYIPFQSTVKVHSLHLTSIPPSSSEDDDDDDDDDEVPMRPKTIKLYTNRANNLGFDEADDLVETQSIELSADSWNKETATAKVELRFVKFQNITSLVMFVVDGDGDGEKVRLDRVRIIGEKGEKREMGKLEKIGDHDD